VSAPRRVLVAYDDVRSLAGYELYRALRRAGLRRGQLVEATAALESDDGDPDLAYRAILFLQAVALELELREAPDPAPTWDDAQGWDVRAGSPGEADPLADDERAYRVAASIATGLPADDAMRVPIADVEAFARARGPG